jgi:hypothetical protein
VVKSKVQVGSHNIGREAGRPPSGGAPGEASTQEEWNWRVWSKQMGGRRVRFVLGKDLRHSLSGSSSSLKCVLLFLELGKRITSFSAGCRDNILL